MSLIKNDIELKECTFEDFKKVYEYDFSKLTNIWQDIEFEKNSNNEKIVQADTKGNSNETYEDDDATYVIPSSVVL